MKGVNMVDIIDVIYQCNDILKENNVISIKCDIEEILSKRNDDGTVGYQILAIDKEDDSNMYAVRIDMPERQKFQELAEWDYNIDDYLFADLEDGFNIVYMSLLQHYGIWTMIDENINEFDHSEGLNKYLHYCKTHNISRDTIALRDHIAMNVPDIMNSYKEVVSHYTIINEMTFGDKTIVLGYNKDSTSKYATWLTSPTRENYNLAKYYPDEYSALQGFKSRSHKILDDYLYKLNNNEWSLKKKEKYER